MTPFRPVVPALARAPAAPVKLPVHTGVVEFSSTPVHGAVYGLNATLTFMPNKVIQAGATEIAFVQVVKRARNGKPETRNRAHQDTEDRMTKQGSFVDQFTEAGGGKYDRADRSAFYGYAGPSAKPTSNVRPWTTGSKAPAQLLDGPGGSAAVDAPESWRAETAIVIKSGTDAGKQLGVVHWGYDVDASGKVTPIAPEVSAAPTDDFNEAIAKWNAQAKTRKGGMDEQKISELDASVLSGDGDGEPETAVA